MKGKAQYLQQHLIYKYVKMCLDSGCISEKTYTIFTMLNENTVSQELTWFNLQTCWIWTLVFQEFVSYLNSAINSANAELHYLNMPGMKSVTCSLLSDTFTDCWGHVSLTTRWVSSALSSQITRCVCVMWLLNRSLFTSRFACMSTTLKAQRSADCIHDLPTHPFTLHVNFTRFVDMQWPCLQVNLCACIFFFFF